jgi:hypothetical protein
LEVGGETCDIGQQTAVTAEKDALALVRHSLSL